ncbi:hypothetical protein JL100_024410 [Skermanella mucosa]|uniref:hypothetical protein n=1 Tax=Skermanella mucosa TaxID=1789672 RepID=UPI00192BAEAE|nr:hypothetical protein [Skermanella mucosa]UEM20187.1 hypothetical protein JL100_024410 [Skermanella mucosa]
MSDHDQSISDQNSRNDQTERLRFRPGQAVQTDANGIKAGQAAGPGSPTAAASSSGGSGDHLAPEHKGLNPVADGTERVAAADDAQGKAAEGGDGARAEPATS